jgi:hypothetical protein
MCMKNTTPRKDAKNLGLIYYDGKPCLHGHGTKRYVANGDCVTCRNIIKAKAARAKRVARGAIKLGRKRKYPVFVGPPKPKRQQIYDKTTEFGAWVWRSKNGNKAKLRSSLAVEDYKKLKNTHCPLLGIELTYSKYCGTTPNNYATLDRIDPQKGYVMGNVQIISFRANTLKGDASIEELEFLIKNWKKLNV